jgi:hypothetical protein
VEEVLRPYVAGAQREHDADEASALNVSRARPRSRANQASKTDQVATAAAVAKAIESAIDRADTPRKSWQNARYTG